MKSRGSGPRALPHGVPRCVRVRTVLVHGRPVFRLSTMLGGTVRRRPRIRSEEPQLPRNLRPRLPRHGLGGRRIVGGHGGLRLFHAEGMDRRAIVPIGELRLGQIAKVAGVIVSNSSIVFGGREVDTDGGWVWSWDGTGSFAVTDGAGTGFATMERGGEAGPGLHPAPNPGRTSGAGYMSGDRGYMIGWVASGAD